MRKTTLLVIAVLLTVGSLTSCNGEPKPKTQGVFQVVATKVIELQPTVIDKDFTPEGFMITSFTGEPRASCKPGDSYFIFNGDYSSFSLRQFSPRGNRFEEDTPRDADVARALEVGQVVGEKNMRKARINKDLPAGTYVLDAQGPKGPVAFAFTIQ